MQARRRCRSKTPERSGRSSVVSVPGGECQNTLDDRAHVSPAKPVRQCNGGSLWTLGLVERLLDLIWALQLSMARFWFDERGNTPVGRFLEPDRPGEAFLPTRRVSYFVLMGLMLTMGGVYFTEDEYIQGPHSMDDADNACGKVVTNASDFPVHIAFRNVGCHIDGRHDPALAGITGEIMPGKLTAILGRSGSGKTTLANLILGRSRNFCHRQSGTVYMNGRARSLEVVLDRVGFVPQDDILYPELTVEETVLFSAQSRLPRFASQEYTAKVLEDTLVTLGLGHVRKSKISSLSGGEIKRVSIGMELITQPSILIMDEPTSGLDSAAAYHMMKTIREIADNDVAVVAVLHQPTTRIYDLLDELILLKSGKAVYVGPREQVLPYFASIGYVIPEFEQQEKDKFLEISAPEFIVDVLAGVVTPRLPDGVSSAVQLERLWELNGKPEEMWKKIEVGMDARRREEHRRVVALYKSSSDTLSDEKDSVIVPFGLETCDDNYPSVFRYWCYIMYGLSSRGPGDTSYPIRPKSGLVYQVHLWGQTFVRTAWRRGVIVEVLIVVLLSTTASFTRSYNMTWNRKAVGGFFVCTTISLVGMLGALFNDDIGPVRRAADSGMVLGAYEFALVGFVFCKGILLVNVYAICYFSVLYLRRGIWCTSPFSLLVYSEFVHMLQLLFMCAHTIGSVLSVLNEHDLYRSYICAIPVFITVHTFAFFAPNKHQIEQDALIFNKVNTAPLVRFLCSLSYVRYFMEAIMLWEPLDDDDVGRNSALRFFGYEQEHKTMCYSCLFAIWTFNLAVRFLIFTRYNRNVFNSLHDTPLFIIFVWKVVVSFLVSLFVMTMFHEGPRLRKMWRHAVTDYKVRNRARSR
mmetsp:Transcript_41146/g.66286  ORF Transcript_41146/g.66286 Transcript_41146/m.66286 type:complete len:861 (-) Transcript_41146:2376-4958(-)